MPVALLCAAAAFLAGLSGSSPRLAVTDADPVAVSATGFRAHERVTVRLRAPGVERTRHRHASARGRFTATFRHAVVDRCSGFTLTAVGSAGSQARVHRAGRGCPPA